jgi:putative toxin-antitoxin system antitoxin component (TIGR02293 family)
MSSKTRAQAYEELKDLRRRGELQQIGDVEGVLSNLTDAAQKELSRNGVFVIPGLAKLVVVKKPATRAHKVSNPISGEMIFKTKPARKVVRQLPARAPIQEHELFRGLEILALADRVFGDEKKAMAWLRQPNASMSGQIPLNLMKDELGAAVVREALEQIDHGIFA